jgi:hypothetical protein
LLLLMLMLMMAAPAAACPVCDRETGRRVRDGLFDEQLGLNVLATLLPFGVFLGVAAAIRYAPLGGRDDPARPR